MKKVIVFVLVMSLSILTFTSCNSKSDNGDRTLKNFLEAYYNVSQSDYDYYEEMTGIKEINTEDSFKEYETNSKKFEQYLSDKSYKYFYASRLSYLRLTTAYKNSIFVEVKDVKLSIYREDKKDKTVGYDYELQLNQVNKNTKKVEIGKRSGRLTVIKEKNNWKIVDSIGLK